MLQRRCGMQQRTEEEQRTENGDVHFLFAFQRIGHPNGAKLQDGYWDSVSASGWKGEVNRAIVCVDMLKE